MTGGRLAGALLFAAAALGGGPARAEEGERIHEVQRGETLWNIARANIGEGFLWPALYRANRDQIKDPAIVYPGQRLRIPTVDRAEREALRREAEAHRPN